MIIPNLFFSNNESLVQHVNVRPISKNISALNEELTILSSFLRSEDVGCMLEPVPLNSCGVYGTNILSRAVTNKHSKPWIDTGVRRALNKKRKLGNRNSDADWASFRKHIDGLSTDASETNTAITCQVLLMLHWNQIIPNLFGTILNRYSLTLLVSHH